MGNHSNNDLFFRGAMYVFGFGLSIAGGVSCIGYLNLLTTGYRLKDYFYFILGRTECYLLPLGLIIISRSIFMPDRAKRKE